jgi:phosphoglycerate kinase
MIYNLKNVQNADIKNKKVVLRVDVDVPVENGQIQDDSRLKAWFPTLEFLLKSEATVYLIGHLGRPKQQFTIHDSQTTIDDKFSLKPVAQWIAQKLQGQLADESFGSFKGWKVTDRVFLLENLRFFKEEEENNEEFAKKLSELGEIYVNDAFASAHRAHASTSGITKYLPSFAGLRILKEAEELSKVLENPDRPLAVIIGGAKIETKLPLVEKMHAFADFVLVGGEIAENDKVLLKVQHENLLNRKSVLLVADLNPELKDITSKSAENFLQVLQNAGSIVWNGPMGLVEEEAFAVGTKTLADGIANLNCYKLLGGGDTVSCIQKMGFLDKFSFVSIGGGAMLEFLAGERLPGLVVLEEK